MCYNHPTMMLHFGSPWGWLRRRGATRGWLLCLLSLAVAPAAWAEAPPVTPVIMPLAQIQPGMTGQGRTVFRGTDIATFGFEVLDVLQSDGYSPSLLLVRLNGPTIDQIGGIAAGMSGSPLYLDGKLAAAIAFTTPFSDTRIGYATAIEDMLKVLDREPAQEPAAVATATAPPRWPVGTPVLGGGLSGRALAAVTRLLARRGLRVLPMAVPSARPRPQTEGLQERPPAAEASGELAPGSAVAASLTTGDIVLTALGTVTWRDGERLLAFGHPFMQRGQTSLFLHPAYIYATVPSDELPFKIGAPAGEAAGAFTQDRAAGMGAVLGQAPEAFPVRIEAVDRTLRRRRTLNVEVVRDETLAPALVAATLLQALDEVADRAGPGTVAIDWTVDADGLGQPVQRTDLIYSDTDVVGETAPGLLYALDALLANDLAEVRPRRVTVRAEVSTDRRTARLLEARVTPTVVQPGQALTVTVRLQPYRAAAEEHTLTLNVPPEEALGAPERLVLDVHGLREGTATPWSAAAFAAQGLEPPATLGELAAALGGAQAGNVLVAELLTPDAAAARDAVRLAGRPLVALPDLELFSEDPAAVPLVRLGPEVTAVPPLARAELRLERVVLGHHRLRLRLAVPVAAP